MMNRKTHNIGTIGIDLTKGYTPMVTGPPKEEPIKEQLKYKKQAPIGAFVAEVKRKKKFTCD
jgi:hypothetical protein